MRYSKGKDWVEFQPGVAQLPMRKVFTIASVPDEIAKWVKASHFVAADGTAHAITDGNSIMDGLTFGQWDWLTDQFKLWARDDAIDPEA